MKMVGNYVLIELVKEDMTESGLIVSINPGHVLRGVVCNVADGKDICIGNKVLFHRGSIKQDWKHDGRELVVVYLDDIITVIEDGDHVSLS